MNFHALAPKRYKRSMVSGFIYRIHRACSSWNLFHESLGKEKRILECNQYPPAFYEPIIKQALDTIIGASTGPSPDSQLAENQRSEKLPIMVQYRGKCTENYARAQNKCPMCSPYDAPQTQNCPPLVKTSSRENDPKRSCVCPCCTACYVGETGRHMQSRFKEHVSRAGPMRNHLMQCNAALTENDVDILQQTSRGEGFLLTLEALYIRERKPTINTKDEYHSRELTIKL